MLKAIVTECARSRDLKLGAGFSFVLMAIPNFTEFFVRRARADDIHMAEGRRSGLSPCGFMSFVTICKKLR